MTEYTNCLSLEQMKYFNLFDNIPYKYLKDIIHYDDDYDFEVEIEDMPCDRVAWCKTKFTFDLRIDISQGSLPIYVNKTYTVEIEYNNSSSIALTLMELVLLEQERNEESEEDTDEDTDEDEEEDEEESEQEESEDVLSRQQ